MLLADYPCSPWREACERAGLQGAHLEQVRLAEETRYDTIPMSSILALNPPNDHNTGRYSQLGPFSDKTPHSIHFDR